MELGKSLLYDWCEGGANTVRTSRTDRGQLDLYFYHLVWASRSDDQSEDEIGPSKFVSVGEGERPLW